MSRIPTSDGLDAIARIIRHRADAVDLSRPSESTGRFGEGDSSTTTVSSVPIWLNPPRTILQNTEFGDRETADAVGLASAGTNVEYGDRLTDGSTTYEVDTIEYIPTEENTKFLRIAFIKRVND